MLDLNQDLVTQFRVILWGSKTRAPLQHDDPFQDPNFLRSLYALRSTGHVVWNEEEESWVFHFFRDLLSPDILYLSTVMPFVYTGAMEVEYEDIAEYLSDKYYILPQEVVPSTAYNVYLEQLPDFSEGIYLLNLHLYKAVLLEYDPEIMVLLWEGADGEDYIYPSLGEYYFPELISSRENAEYIQNLLLEAENLNTKVVFGKYKDLIRRYKIK